MPNWTVFPDETPSKQAVALAEQIERDGGHALAIYREPVGDHWQIFCLLPMATVEPTPYQRDLSPAHVKRLLAVLKKIDRFVDPIVVTSPRAGVYWPPHGHHRRGAFAPILRRVDKFLGGTFPKTLREREERAAMVRAADEVLNEVVARIKKRGISHPYVKTFVLARTTPLTRQRKTLPNFDQTFKKLKANLEEFDVAKVRYEDI